ncbi:hypothetical protein LTR10_020911 [Elasticomyces elasticus]|uniref:Cytochrome P450 n=1 Tax=Exophiala sideris TaxID=1016849 RepID=A0ABR0JBS6_9EURO|nr:hypothetical protein LTR10_020911 [Elasticomyces elasticus]KAK5031131.1 hypothetical protein LTS07_004866 [Exophiala sideris]KAK5038852.1 hypothetical protein LTR13_003883 [Exophiala sideris]KAK5060736.1 hypothetical protein LTR69_005335 [Exophiala sideris]KAK5183648.1 hypothetical protein LTR44_003930 [Eurotiomycetes sp. CCFEE 6388]
MYAPIAILIIICAYVVYRISSSARQSRLEAAEASVKGCEPPTWFQHGWLFGLDFMYNILRADVAGRAPAYLKECFDTSDNQAKTIRFAQGPSDGFVTCDPENIKALLLTQFSDYGLGYLRIAQFGPAVGSGVFTQDGKAWEHSRALLRPQFNREQILNLETAETNIQNLMKHLDVEFATRWTQEIDLQRLIVNLTLDGATEFLFGESVDAQLTALQDRNHGHTSNRPLGKDQLHSHAALARLFGQNFDNMMRGVGYRTRMLDMYWLYDTPSFRRSIRGVHQFADHYVQLALSNQKPTLEKGSFSDGTEDSSSRYTFLTALAAETQDPVVLRSQLLNILLAGRDTTAGLIGYIFHILSLPRNEQWYRWLRAAIIRDFGPYQQSPGQGQSYRPISTASLRTCPELLAIIHETLRLYPPVPINSRLPLHASATLPRGGGPDGQSPVFLRKGENCDYSVYIMQRRKDIWGPDAEIFNPERWLDRQDGSWKTAIGSGIDDGRFLPFNAGPRICMGMNYAITQTSVVVVRLLQRFEALERCVEREVEDGKFSGVEPEERWRKLRSYLGTGNGKRGIDDVVAINDAEEKENPRTGQGITWGRMKYGVVIMPERLWVKFREA